ncbi:unnamed protein product [Prorocentrum cordatum]|uniref:Uncharacterized protein n=1 Tax=Prorocentrum cordatum TaxID=2364126 RepID=A0ABN9SSC0_9DINO|nr:unnamed protein product [Polarella glacialis]
MQWFNDCRGTCVDERHGGEGVDPLQKLRDATISADGQTRGISMNAFTDDIAKRKQPGKESLLDRRDGARGRLAPASPFPFPFPPPPRQRVASLVCGVVAVPTVSSVHWQADRGQPGQPRQRWRPGQPRHCQRPRRSLVAPATGISRLGAVRVAHAHAVVEGVDPGLVSSTETDRLVASVARLLCRHVAEAAGVAARGASEAWKERRPWRVG